MRSLDPDVLQIHRRDPPGRADRRGRIERGPLRCCRNAVGRGRVQTTVRLAGERRLETASRSSDVSPRRSPATARLRRTPAAVRHACRIVRRRRTPSRGGGRPRSSARRRRRYVVEYPYGGAEHARVARIVMAVASDLGDASICPARREGSARSRARLRCASWKHSSVPGRLRFLAGRCRSVSPYLTSYVAHVYQTRRR